MSKKNYVSASKKRNKKSSVKSSVSWSNNHYNLSDLNNMIKTNQQIENAAQITLSNFIMLNETVTPTSPFNMKEIELIRYFGLQSCSYDDDQSNTIYFLHQDICIASIRISTNKKAIQIEIAEKQFEIWYNKTNHMFRDDQNTYEIFINNSLIRRLTIMIGFMEQCGLLH